MKCGRCKAESLKQGRFCVVCGQSLGHAPDNEKVDMHIARLPYPYLEDVPEKLPQIRSVCSKQRSSKTMDLPNSLTKLSGHIDILIKSLEFQNSINAERSCLKLSCKHINSFKNMISKKTQSKSNTITKDFYSSNLDKYLSHIEPISSLYSKYLEDDRTAYHRLPKVDGTVCKEQDDAVNKAWFWGSSRSSFDQDQINESTRNGFSRGEKPLVETGGTKSTGLIWTRLMPPQPSACVEEEGEDDSESLVQLVQEMGNPVENICQNTASSLLQPNSKVLSFLYPNHNTV